MKAFEAYKKIIKVINHPDNQPHHFEAIFGMIENFRRYTFEDCERWFYQYNLHVELENYCNDVKKKIDNLQKV